MANKIKSDHDKVFDSELKTIPDFKFGENVVRVFDDMVSRSVPFYDEMQRMIGEQVADFATPGTNVYDLGCSTGTTLLGIDPLISKDVHFVGIDNSPEMVERCRQNFKESGVRRKYEIQYDDLNEGVKLEKASVVILCLTLQFVRPQRC